MMVENKNNMGKKYRKETFSKRRTRKQIK